MELGNIFRETYRYDLGDIDKAIEKLMEHIMGYSNSPPSCCLVVVVVLGWLEHQRLSR